MSRSRTPQATSSTGNGPEYSYLKKGKALKILVYGIGNPGRRDDGLGPVLAGRIENASFPGVTVDANYQLNVEDAPALSEHDLVIFVDASKDGPEPFSFEEVTPSGKIAFTTHEMAPASVLALSEELYGRCPEARLLAVRGYDWEIGEGLSKQASHNLEAAEDFLKNLLMESSVHH